MLCVALVLISLLLPVGGASVKPARVFFNRASEIVPITSLDKQISEPYFPRLIILLLNLNDAEHRNKKVFREALQDGKSPIKRQEEKASESTVEDSTINQKKRKEGCKFFYWKSRTAC